MASRRPKGVDPLLLDDDPEQEYTVTIRMSFSGFGRREHQLKQISEARRVVEVAMQRPIETHVYDSTTMSWEPAERLDRNAKQRRGEEVSDDAIGGS